MVKCRSHAIGRVKSCGVNMEWRWEADNVMESRRWEVSRGRGLECFWRIVKPTDKRTKTKAIVYRGLEYPSDEGRETLVVRVHERFDSMLDAKRFAESIGKTVDR